MFKFLYDIIAIKKGHLDVFRLPSLAQKHLLLMLAILSRLIRVPFADVPRSCTSTPSLYLAARMSGKVVVSASLGHLKY